MDIPSTLYLNKYQTQKVNVLTISSNTRLTKEMSGSVVIADLGSASSDVIYLSLPQVESGLYFKIIIKMSSSPRILQIVSTKNDNVNTLNDTNSQIINFVGGLTLSDLNVNTRESYAFDSQNNIRNLNIFNTTNVNSIQAGITNALKTPLQVTSDNINVMNTTGDWIELVCDGTNWYGTGNSKNKSFFSGNISSISNNLSI